MGIVRGAQSKYIKFRKMSFKSLYYSVLIAHNKYVVMGRKVLLIVFAEKVKHGVEGKAVLALFIS